MEKNYKLLDIASGEVFEDSGWDLGGASSLVRAIYREKVLRVGSAEDGLFTFRDWLPIYRELKGSSAPITYKSEGLAKCLGLNNLYITFSGYYPEIGATMTSCAFKETEAYAVCGRLSEDIDKVLVVASAGNTARAFAKVCSENNIPLLLCIPEDNLDALWFETPIKDCVKVIATASGSDYFDAINISNTVVESDKFIAEGGAKNVARRDGMGTTMLSAVTTIGAIPDLYFQAIGSGTGAVAAWEANMRFIESGVYGDKKSRLVLSQNYPFLPMYEAWRVDSRELLHYDDDMARLHVETIDAKVLSNRKPPYSIVGGVYDALKDTNGTILSVDNSDAAAAGELFERVEGIDIHPAAAVATASLINYVKENNVDKDSVIMLNITGGGEKRFKGDKEIFYLKASKVFPYNFCKEEVLEYVNNLF